MIVGDQPHRSWRHTTARSQPGLQLHDPPVGPLQLRGQVHHQPRQLLIGGLRLLGLGHGPDDRRSKPEDQADTPTRSPEIKPGSTAQLSRPREWTQLVALADDDAMGGEVEGGQLRRARARGGRQISAPHAPNRETPC